MGRRLGTNIGVATIPKTVLLVDLVLTRQLFWKSSLFDPPMVMVMLRSTCCCLAAIGGS